MVNLHKTGQILYISSVDVSIGNGPGVNEREFILALHNAIKDRVHFLIPRPVNEVPDLPITACTFTFPHRRHNPIFFPAHILSQFRLTDQLLSRRQFDLLVFRLDVLPFAPLFITRKHQIPYALKTLGQGLMNVLNERGGWLGKSLMGVNRRLVKQLLTQALLADSVSIAQVEFLQQILDVNSQKIVWIDNAVNINRFFPSSPTDARKELGLLGFDPIIGYVGTRPWERGGMQLVEAAPRLLAKYPNLGLVILGDGQQLETLKKRAQELQVENHCLFTGYVPFDQVPLYINSLDVGVSISLRDDRRAASELKVRQYLACGKPIVVSPGSNDFVITENFGSIVEPTDLEAITTELDRWLSLTADERSEFEYKVTQYIRHNLSMEAAIAQRLKLWTERYPLPQQVTSLSKPCKSS
jgi:glycosyltransferase involved in cell wall biosynthesis